MTESLHIVIAGGGIGGLTAALSCAHFGHKVTLLEQAPELGEVGAGLQISPNAMKVFRALGIADNVAAKAVAPDMIEARMGRSGTVIFSVPLAQYARETWGAPYLHIHRADYITALHRAISDQTHIDLVLGAGVEGYEHASDVVCVKVQDGRMFYGDVLIGTDGVKSTVRAQMLGPETPRFTGNVAWRAVVPMERLGDLAPERTACVWMGPGRHAVTYHIRGGTLANFVGVVERDDWQTESWTEAGERAELATDFAGWHPVISHLISAIPQDNIFKWALFDRDPLGAWTDRRVALLGDAAHPMLPFLAQGATMAVEDAWALAVEVTRHSDNPVQALQHYQVRRFARTQKVQQASRANMGLFHKRGALSQILTYGPMWLGAYMFPTVVNSRLNWLYGHDETRL